MHSKKASTTVPRDVNIDDYIGMESCVDLKDRHRVPDMPSPKNFPEVGGNNKMWEMGRKDQKDYPPPIPLLVRSENVASHRPWVMKRHYTSDGRLILTEEKPRHHEFFRTYRCNGRLMLQLVAVEEQVPDELNAEVGDEEAGEEERAVVGRNEGGKWYTYGNVRGRNGAFTFGVAVPAASLETV